MLTAKSGGLRDRRERQVGKSEQGSRGRRRRGPLRKPRRLADPVRHEPLVELVAFVEAEMTDTVVL